MIICLFKDNVNLPHQQCLPHGFEIFTEFRVSNNDLS